MTMADPIEWARKQLVTAEHVKSDETGSLPTAEVRALVDAYDRLSGAEADLKQMTGWRDTALDEVAKAEAAHRHTGEELAKEVELRLDAEVERDQYKTAQASADTRTASWEALAAAAEARVERAKYQAAKVLEWLNEWRDWGLEKCPEPKPRRFNGPMIRRRAEDAIYAQAVEAMARHGDQEKVRLLKLAFGPEGANFAARAAGVEDFVSALRAGNHRPKGCDECGNWTDDHAEGCPLASPTATPSPTTCSEPT
jgi:hypothetical protein